MSDIKALAAVAVAEDCLRLAAAQLAQTRSAIEDGRALIDLVQGADDRLAAIEGSILRWRSLTQAQYDALAVKEPTVLYIVRG